MKMKARLDKLENAMLPIKGEWKAHRIIINGSGGAEEAIAEFKRNHHVGPDDDFNIFHLIKPKNQDN